MYDNHVINTTWLLNSSQVNIYLSHVTYLAHKVKRAIFAYLGNISGGLTKGGIYQRTDLDINSFLKNRFPDNFERIIQHSKLLCLMIRLAAKTINSCNSEKFLHRISFIKC